MRFGQSQDRALPRRFGRLGRFSHPTLHALDDTHICAYNPLVRIEWDPEKARRNREKHGVAFPDAAGVLEDELAVTLGDPFSESEERFMTVGTDPLGRVLVVVYTWRGERIRLISARKATARERRQYEEG